MALSIKLAVIKIRIFKFAVRLLTTGRHTVLRAVPLMNRHLSEFCCCCENNSDTLVEAVGQLFCQFICRILDRIKEEFGKVLTKSLSESKSHM